MKVTSFGWKLKVLSKYIVIVIEFISGSCKVIDQVVDQAVDQVVECDRELELILSLVPEIAEQPVLSDQDSSISGEQNFAIKNCLLFLSIKVLFQGLLLSVNRLNR